MEECLQFGANKWRKGLFEGYCEDMDEGQNPDRSSVLKHVETNHLTDNVFLFPPCHSEKVTLKL
jgi:hypothetical protein